MNTNTLGVYNILLYVLRNKSKNKYNKISMCSTMNKLFCKVRYPTLKSQNEQQYSNDFQYH